MRRELIYLFIALIVSSSIACESDLDRRIRIERERQEHAEQERIELEERSRREAALEKQLAQEAIEREKAEAQKAEEDRQRALQQVEVEKQRQIELEYGNANLRNGALPWRDCFGRNADCDSWGCSQVVVNTSSTNDVVVVIKQGERVKKHAYITAGKSYTFEMPNGYYQPFFYSGKGWYPEKEMDSRLCASLKGGFLKYENWSKDEIQHIDNTILTYTLQQLPNGNFTTKPSNQEEAL